MTELKPVDRNFTWSNRHVLSKTVRAIVNVEWLCVHPHLEACVMDPSFSGHSPIAINFAIASDNKCRPFRF